MLRESTKLSESIYKIRRLPLEVRGTEQVRAVGLQAVDSSHKRLYRCKEGERGRKKSELLVWSLWSSPCLVRASEGPSQVCVIYFSVNKGPPHKSNRREHLDANYMTLINPARCSGKHYAPRPPCLHALGPIQSLPSPERAGARDAFSDCWKADNETN